MYGIFTYVYHTNQPNVGKYTIHGWYGGSSQNIILFHTDGNRILSEETWWPNQPRFFMGEDGQSLLAHVGFGMIPIYNNNFYNLHISNVIFSVATEIQLNGTIILHCLVRLKLHFETMGILPQRHQPSIPAHHRIAEFNRNRFPRIKHRYLISEHRFRSSFLSMIHRLRNIYTVAAIQFSVYLKKTPNKLHSQHFSENLPCILLEAPTCQFECQQKSCKITLCESPPSLPTKPQPSQVSPAYRRCWSSCSWPSHPSLNPRYHPQSYSWISGIFRKNMANMIHRFHERNRIIQKHCKYFGMAWGHFGFVFHIPFSSRWAGPKKHQKDGVPCCWRTIMGVSTCWRLFWMVMLLMVQVYHRMSV